MAPGEGPIKRPRDDLEAELRRHVDIARARYDAAKYECKRLQEIHEAASATSDCILALRQAAILQRQTQVELRMALDDFTEFLVRGQLPRSDQRLSGSSTDGDVASTLRPHPMTERESSPETAEAHGWGGCASAQNG